MNKESLPSGEGNVPYGDFPRFRGKQRLEDPQNFLSHEKLTGDWQNRISEPMLDRMDLLPLSGFDLLFIRVIRATTRMELSSRDQFLRELPANTLNKEELEELEKLSDDPKKLHEWMIAFWKKRRSLI